MLRPRCRDGLANTLPLLTIYPQRPLPYREFKGEGARDQAGLLFVAQETADEHNRIELVPGEP